jgi:hypothetical protein
MCALQLTAAPTKIHADKKGKEKPGAVARRKK